MKTTDRMILDEADKAYRETVHAEHPDVLFRRAQAVRGDRRAYRRAMRCYRAAAHTYHHIVHMLQTAAYYAAGRQG